jgi:hypothetical protein
MARNKPKLAGFLAICTLAVAQKDNGKECDCFRTNGSTEAYFSYHQFFDYRNVSPKLTANPDVLTNATETQDAGNSSSFFSDASFTADWTIPNWDNSDSLNTAGSDASVLMINSPNNVYIGKFPFLFEYNNEQSDNNSFPQNLAQIIVLTIIRTSLSGQPARRISSPQVKLIL